MWLFLINDMQTPPPPLRSDHINMKDAQCTETNEISIFRFVFYELWSILYSKFLENWPKYHQEWPKKMSFKSGHLHMKDAQWAETNEKSIFQFWDMVVQNS